jgi:hypothetical protein
MTAASAQPTAQVSGQTGATGLSLLHPLQPRGTRQDDLDLKIAVVGNDDETIAEGRFPAALDLVYISRERIGRCPPSWLILETDVATANRTQAECSAGVNGALGGQNRAYN